MGLDHGRPKHDGLLELRDGIFEAPHGGVGGPEIHPEVGIGGVLLDRLLPLGNDGLNLARGRLRRLSWGGGGGGRGEKDEPNYGEETTGAVAYETSTKAHH